MPNEGDTITFRGRRYEFSNIYGDLLYVIDRIEPDGCGRGRTFTLTAAEAAELSA